jgi:Cell division control protein 14, SIN component
MESLLSLSFDHLSSYDPGKIRKGLRQVEGLLAQICLSKTKAEKRRSSVAVTSSPATLEMLREDAAFREFFKLQEGFEWNLCIRLIQCLERLMGRGDSE